MNLNERANEKASAPATPTGIMNSADGYKPRGVQVNGAIPQKCIICGDPTAERCFCKIHRKDSGPIMLCCPDCALQYLESARPAADSHEEELRAFEKSTHFFIGEDKPWS